MKYLWLVWSGIWRKPARAVLIILQIALAFLLFGLLQGMKSGMEAVIEKLDADLHIVQRAAGMGPLPLSMYSQLQAIPGVKSVSYRSYLPGTYQQPSQRVMTFAIDVESGMRDIPGLSMPKETLAALKQTRTGAAISRALADRYGWRTGDRVPIQTEPYFQKKDGSLTWEFDVVGTFEPGEQSGIAEFMIINYDYLEESRVNSSDTVDIYFVRVADAAKPLPVVQAIDRFFSNSSNETRTESLRDAMRANLQRIGDLDFVVRSVVGAALFALLFSIGALMMQSVRERTIDLAVLKALGYSDRKVFGIILSEALMLCFAAAALGLALASWILPGARRFTTFEVSMPSSVLMFGAVMALVLALVSAAVPAWRALRLEVARALGER